MCARLNIANSARYPDLKQAELLRLIEWILETEGQPPWQLTVVFVDDEYMKDLNERFLQRSTFTDVLSFNLSEIEKAEGEVYISIDTAKRNSQYYGVTLDNELFRLVAHGVYHLLDYDDVTEEDKRIMTELEDKALAYILSPVSF
ncbi:rRNA maturation RNase YbeY [candidate division KSB1 bacterium]|nr:rRNA maturation RNase YbeY [candidate division KSB1 bacterium]RQW08789.1 MAG: rRNA maturation RNase YbeY [candidate division KSB1 bacterium]